MATLSYRSTNIRFAFICLLTSAATAIGIQKFGPGPILILCIVPWLILLFYRYPFGLMAFWVILLLPAITFPNFFLAGGSFQFLPLDPAYFFGTVYLIMNALMEPQKFVIALKQNFLLALFILIVLVYIVIYMPLYGKSALGEARKDYFIFFFPLLATFTIKQFGDLRRFLLLIYFLACSLSIIFILRSAMGEPIRHAANAQSSLILALTIFSILIYHINGQVITTKIMDIGFLLLFSLIIAMSLHRSVLLAVLFGLLLMFILYRKRIAFLLQLVVSCIGFLLLMIIIVTSVPSFGQSATHHLKGLVDPSSDHTASWRMEGWNKQLSKLSGDSLLFGEGLGMYYSWYYSWGQKNKHLITASPHNGYVQLILKFGLLGLIMYCLLAGWFFRKTIAARKILTPGPMKAYVEMGILNVGAAHIYALGYSIDFIVLIFFALAMRAVRLSEISWTVRKSGRMAELETVAF